ncbi:MAG: prolyl oligopeptidase family serine peptidase [Hyphomonadaceae bacterium]
MAASRCPYPPFYSGYAGKLWLENGGVYVIANIRGGSRFGPAWHQAGLRTNRQVIYDDYAVEQDLSVAPHHQSAGLASRRLQWRLADGRDVNQHPG